MLYPTLRFLTFLFALGANYLSPRPTFAWIVFRAWSEAYLGERWNVWHELKETGSSRNFTRGLAGSRKQCVYARVLLGK